MTRISLQLGSSVVVILILQSLRGTASDEVLLSCSFEVSCGLGHSTNSQFYWSRISGPTPNQNTGPSLDHTLRNSIGQYIYAPSSKNGHDFGQRSSLYSPEYQLTSGQGRIEFYYHMWDGYNPNDMGTLSVFVCGASAPLWTRQGNQGNRWRWTGQIEFSCQKGFRVYFVVSRGKYQSDIAIDDLIITDVYGDPTTPSQSDTTTQTTHSTALTHTAVVASQRSTPSTTTKSTTTTKRTTQKPPSTTRKVLTGLSTRKPRSQTSKAPSKASMTLSITTTVSKMTTSHLEAEEPTSVVANVDSPSSNVGIDVDPNSQSSSSSSSIGPIVVACVTLLFIGLTLCLAVQRKKSLSNPPASSDQASIVKYAVENPSYGGVEEADSITNGNPQTQAGNQSVRRTDNYSYRELLQQSSRSSDEETGRGNDGANATLDQSSASNQDSENKECVSKRRGESVLYAAIPDQGGANEYS